MMSSLLGYFVKRIPREGFKSLSVPALALALAFLISVLGGINAQMEAEYEYMMKSHEVLVLISDGDGSATDELEIEDIHLSKFTDPEALFSLYEYVDNVVLKRVLDIIGESRENAPAMLIGIDNESQIGYFSSVYSLINDDVVDFDHGVSVEYLGGLDGSIFQSGNQQPVGSKNLCLISEDLLDWVDDGILKFSTIQHMGPNTRVKDYWLTVAGIVRGSADHDFSHTVFSYAFIANYVEQTPDFNGSNRLSYEGKSVLYYSQEIHVTSELPIIGALAGISAFEAYDSQTPESGVEAVFFNDYDESILRTDEYVCVVSEDVLDWAQNGALTLMVRSRAGAIANPTEARLKVVGTVSGAGRGLVFTPFTTVSEIAYESDGQHPQTELLRATISDNRELSEFKQAAMRTFREVGTYFNRKVFSMVIYDQEFYDKTEAQMQTMFFISIATPAIYVISTGIGFSASTLITRRRKSEFAIMRSIGVNRLGIFSGALLEQLVLCAFGVAVGAAVFALIMNFVFIERLLIFLGCYMLGAVVSSVRAAGTDVLSLLRDKE